MKIAILALLYLTAPALMVTEKLSEMQQTSPRITVVYKSIAVPIIPISCDIPYVVDEENCEEERVDFAPPGEGLLRHTMLRVE